MVDLRVPKRAVPVEVVLPGGEARKASVHLAEGAATHPGPERLSDLLNGSAPFIPALEASRACVAPEARSGSSTSPSGRRVLFRQALSRAVARNELRQLLERNDIALPA